MRSERGEKPRKSATHSRAFDLEMMGLALEGLALVSEGYVEQGMSQLDEAATAALAGELEEELVLRRMVLLLPHLRLRARARLRSCGSMVRQNGGAFA